MSNKYLLFSGAFLTGYLMVAVGGLLFGGIPAATTFVSALTVGILVGVGAFLVFAAIVATLLSV